MRRAIPLLLSFLSCLAGPACGGRLEPMKPESTLRAYVDAVRAGDAETAYALLDEETRAELSMEAFRATFESNLAELRSQTEALERQLGRGGVTAEARVTLADHRTVLLLEEDGAFRIEGGVLEAPVLRNPRDAVLALRQALARRSLRGIQRVVARTTRAEMEAEIVRFLEETADDLDLDYEIRGNRATVRTTGGREIELIREAGEWRVLEIE